MTVSTTTAKSGPYAGSGTTGPFTVGFRFLENSHILVVKNVAGVETNLVLDTDYTVTGAGASSGSVTLATALATGQTLTIVRNVPTTQETDYVAGDSFPAESHERALDQLTMIAQQLKEEVDRSAKLPVSSSADADALVADIVLLADISTDVSAVAAIEADVSAVAAIDANVTTVAGIAANVTTVAGIAANVTTVAGISAAVSTVAGIAANVTTVAGISANVTTVAGISAAVSTVATNIVDIQNAEENADDAIAAKNAALVAQAAAEAARDQTLAVYDSFDDRYLGSKTSDPTLDNDGNALVAGAIYFNSVSGVMRLYTGSAWVAAYVQGVASSIGFTPTGGIAATDVQAAIAEVDSEAAKLAVAQSFTAAQRGAVSALTDASTITPDFSLANNFSVTLGGSRTLANPTNLTAGQAGIIVITQDGTGSRTLAYGSYFKFPTGTAPTLTTTASAVDVLAYYVESSTRITARMIGDVK